MDSRKNQDEAEVIVLWITQNKDKLEKLYQDKKSTEVAKIEDIVVVITPFKWQANYLKQQLKKTEGLKHIRVGTVQGAESPVVIFSPVYTSFDMNPSMLNKENYLLNVAVSRAKDFFLVIGDMDIFIPTENTASGLLARHLFKSSKQELPLPKPLT